MTFCCLQNVRETSGQNRQNMECQVSRNGCVIILSICKTQEYQNGQNCKKTYQQNSASDIAYLEAKNSFQSWCLELTFLSSGAAFAQVISRVAHTRSNEMIETGSNTHNKIPFQQLFTLQNIRVLSFLCLNTHTVQRYQIAD